MPRGIIREGQKHPQGFKVIFTAGQTGILPEGANWLLDSPTVLPVHILRQPHGKRVLFSDSHTDDQHFLKHFFQLNHWLQTTKDTFLSYSVIKLE